MSNRVFPVSPFIPEITSHLAGACNLVLQAEPGAGKSTVLPLSLLACTWLNDKKIIMLEPRRIAAKNIAFYLAKQLGEQVGQRVGYHVKNDKKVSGQTRLEIMTEGVLVRRLQNDAELLDTALIIFDEFHERSLQGDLSLLFALDVQNTIREDLKILVMSATIDTALMSDYLGGCPVVSCPGRTFSVDVLYQSACKKPLNQQVLSALRPVLQADKVGDTLVFLAGQSAIKQCLKLAVDEFRQRHDLVFLPLFGGLSLAQQEQVLNLDSKGRRRIIFTTNIAETSLTIQGVTCVIDSGLEKVLVYDPASYMTRLQTVFISKASAEQRKGRAGRIQAGSCVRLWSEAKHKTLRPFQGEEILSADLSHLILELLLWGERDYDRINWLTAPPKAHFDAALASLLSLGLIDTTNKLTLLGEKATRLGVNPRLAAMLLRADGELEQCVACELAALLSEKDIFMGQSGSDLVERLVVLQEYKMNQRHAEKASYINRLALEHCFNGARHLYQIFQLTSSKTVFDLVSLQAIVGRLLLYAYPDRLAKIRKQNTPHYKLANGKGVFLFADDPLFACEWLVVADCDAQKKEGRIMRAAAISFDILSDTLKEQMLEQQEVFYDKNKRKIMGRSITRYGEIEIALKPMPDISHDEFQHCLLQTFETEGLKLLNWTKTCDDWLSRVMWLSRHVDDFPRISAQSLVQNVDQWLLPYITDVKSITELQQVDIYPLILGLLSWDEQQVLAKEAPACYLTPSQKKVAITYQGMQEPCVSVVLQEMFGAVDSPMLAAGKVALRFELLSPARRPIQTTSDLAHFWRHSYFDVAKEMRGRYPKHRWPEQPLLEKAGRSYKEQQKKRN